MNTSEKPWRDSSPSLHSTLFPVIILWPSGEDLCEDQATFVHGNLVVFFFFFKVKVSKKPNMDIYMYGNILIITNYN